MSKQIRPTVAVVGAGLAGLAAAWRLSKQGFAVAVFERARGPGGRARSEKLDGFTLEAAGPLLSTGDRKLLAWIDEMGLRDELLPLRPVVKTHWSDGRSAVVDSRRLPGIARIPGVRPLEALRLLRLPRLAARYGERIDLEAPERAADLDDRSIGDFGRLYFGRSVLAHWIEPFVTEESLGEAEELSRVLFLRRHRARARERPGVLRAALGEVAAAAAAGLTVRYGIEARRVARRADGGLSLTVGSRAAQQVVEPDAVVLATSAGEAARSAASALVTAERDALAAVRYQPAVSLAVALRRPFYPHTHHIQLAHVGGSPLENVLLEPGMPGGRVPDGRGLALLRATGSWSEANFGAPDDSLSKELMGAFARVVPGAQAAVLFTKLFRVERFMPRFGVGHYRQIARLEAVEQGLRREGRRLYVAGDYRMDPSLEGAVSSGWRAASKVIEDFAR
jgi:oxygen-dependent protoporphyrinogen oxidase